MIIKMKNLKGKPYTIQILEKAVRQPKKLNKSTRYRDQL